MHVAMATSSGNVPEGSLTSSDNSSARRTGSPLRTRFSINSRLVYFQSPSVAITMVPSHGDFVNGRATATPLPSKGFRSCCWVSSRRWLEEKNHAKESPTPAPKMPPFASIAASNPVVSPHSAGIVNSRSILLSNCRQAAAEINDAAEARTRCMNSSAASVPPEIPPAPSAIAINTRLSQRKISTRSCNSGFPA